MDQWWKFNLFATQQRCTPKYQRSFYRFADSSEVKIASKFFSHSTTVSRRGKLLNSWLWFDGNLMERIRHLHI